MSSTTINPTDPGAAEFIQSVLNEDTAVPDLYPDEVILPGGWVTTSGQVLKKAHVRELTGADEEILSRIVARGSDFTRMLNTVLELALVDIDGEPATERMRNTLLVGDRDAILLGIRMVTYGSDYGPTMITCPTCGQNSEVVFELNKDVIYKSIGDAEQVYRDVQLRKGHCASMRLVTVADQALALRKDNLTAAEMNTVLLDQCVHSIDGNRTLGEGTFRQMGAADRRTLVRYLVDNAPGPQLGEVKAVCPKCQEESTIALSLAAMFL